MSRSHARTPPPRQLSTKETLESLTHWKTTFKTFYIRDDAFKEFFKPNVQWDPPQQNYRLDAEQGDGGRSVEELCEELKDLLSTLAGYLPHSYLTDKSPQSSSWPSVWKIIHDHYNVQVSSESLLDFESLHKLPEETHRQYFERLLRKSKRSS